MSRGTNGKGRCVSKDTKKGPGPSSPRFGDLVQLHGPAISTDFNAACGREFRVFGWLRVGKLVAWFVDLVCWLVGRLVCGWLAGCLTVGAFGIVDRHRDDGRVDVMLCGDLAGLMLTWVKPQPLGAEGWAW